MRIGVDLGGTKTEVICLHEKNGKELYRQRVPSPRDDYHATLKNIQQLVLTAEEKMGETGTVGMGIPGTISQDTGCVKNANSTWLNGQPLKKDIEALLGREVRIQNDANCFAVSEATDGAGMGYKTVFGVIIGTGCGGGVVVNGEGLIGINGVAGEWGHNPLPYPRVFVPEESRPPNFTKYKSIENGPTYFADTIEDSEYPGPLCYCGRAGCQELWISGTGFKLDYQRVTGDETKSTHDVIADAARQEPKAVAALNRYIDRLARSLAVVINIIDPDVIVLGGGMSNVAALYDEVPKAWEKYVFSDFVHTKLRPPLHGDSSGVRGAAWLWNEGFEGAAKDKAA